MILQSLFRQNGQSKDVKLDFVANNVLIIKKWVDNIDPESFGFASDNQVGLGITRPSHYKGNGFELKY